MEVFIEIFLLWVLWIAVGWGACHKMDGSEEFIDWLDKDPSCCLSYLLMTVWTIFAFLIYKNGESK